MKNKPLLKEENSNLNLLPKIYQQQVVSQNKLLDKIKQLIKSSEYPLAKLYLFLLKLSNNSKNIGIKINIINFLSEISTKEKNEQESVKFGHKIISWINSLDLNNYNDEVILSFLHILINSSEVCQKNHLILSCWFLFVAKNLCIERAIKDEYINEKIKTLFPLILKKLNDEINVIKDEIMDKKNNYLRLNEEIKKYLNNKNNEIIYKSLKKGEKFFLINEKWVNNFYDFIKL